MEIKGNTLINSPPAQVWAALNDPRVLAKCTPGCKLLEPKGDSEYKMVLELGIAAIKGRYEGEVIISDKVPESSYKIRVKGEGLLGFVNAEGLLSLQGEGDKTRLSYLIEAQVGGKIAGVGQRVLGGIAKLLSGQFFKALEKELNSSGHGGIKG